jgi:hypothetical protein
MQLHVVAPAVVALARWTLKQRGSLRCKTVVVCRGSLCLEGLCWFHGGVRVCVFAFLLLELECMLAVGWTRMR